MLVTLLKDGKAVAHLHNPTQDMLDKYAKRGLEFDLGLRPLEVELPRSAKVDSVRAKRNRLLDEYAWTVSNASPLTKKNQAEWQGYLKALHKVTKDMTEPEAVTWPTAPGLEYEA